MARNATVGLRVAKHVAGHAAGLVAMLALVGSAAASPPPDYDFDWAVVGDSGNLPAAGPDFPLLHHRHVGRVNRNFRIARNEVTTAQWLEFVQAYAPYYDGTRVNSRFTSPWIRWTSSGYEAGAGTEQFPVGVGFHYAARFVNWLHNGKGLDRASFESGVYDTSTFVEDDIGHRSDQIAHDPGARFWIPTLNELIKSAFYDPNRHGPGAGGYWLYPDQGNEPLIPGLPSEGGETSHGVFILEGELPVGSYPHVHSYYGLLGLSGGWSAEWTETVTPGPSRWRVAWGSSTGGTYDLVFDRLDLHQRTSPNGLLGLRVASVMPGPAAWLVGLVGCVAARRRRSSHVSSHS